MLHLNCAAGGMKTKLTLRIDADLLREARVVAAEGDRCVGALLSALLADLVRGRRDFVKARGRGHARLRRGGLQWKPPGARHSLHERQGLTCVNIPEQG